GGLGMVLGSWFLVRTWSWLRPWSRPRTKHQGPRTKDDYLIRRRPSHRIDDDELAWRAHPLEPESKLLFEGGHDPGRARNCRGVAGDLPVVARELLEGLRTQAVIRNELEHEAEGGRLRDTGPIDDRGVKEPAQKYV